MSALPPKADIGSSISLARQTNLELVEASIAMTVIYNLSHPRPV